MDHLTLQERLFLKQFLTSLRQNRASTEEGAWIAYTINKLSNPFILLSNEECVFLTQKLHDRLEDACDCRNELEIDQIRRLLRKMKPDR